MIVYEPPAGATSVPNPRHLSDFPAQLVLHYILSCYAFLQYSSLVLPAAGWQTRAVHLVALLCFPLLPLVYQCINFIKIARCLVQQRPRIASLRHAVAGTSGARARTSERMLSDRHILDIDHDDMKAEVLPYCSVRYLLKSIFLPVITLIVGLHVTFYLSRLQMRYHGATYVATLGLDHRMGWLAIGSLAAAMFSIPLHLMNTQWCVRLTARIRPHSYDEVMVALIVAAVAQDVLLGLTNRPSTLAILFLRMKLDLPTLCVFSMFALAFRFRRLLHGRVVIVAVSCWLFSVVMLQLVYDILEIREIRAGVYHPWNYRWAVKNPHW
ncbi:MAG: hypothetical protein LQ346_007967 [Caloplaca aetnensis]|nr:MAG: hypothetical protein LQ346_007967 [Caloplaca aetnensis]